MLFGRAQEEIDALDAAGIRVEIVPGVTAAQAASADLGVSLTRRGISRSVAFATPRVGSEEQPSDWAASLAHADTAVLYMAAHQAREVAVTLRGLGRSDDSPYTQVARVPAVVDGQGLHSFAFDPVDQRLGRGNGRPRGVHALRR